MPFFKNIAALLLLVIMGQPMTAQVTERVERSSIIETVDGKDYYIHFVKQGETLFSIARSYEVTVNDIFRTNPASREGIKAGDVLKVPVMEDRSVTEGTAPAMETGYFYHIVREDETLFGISRKYGVSVEALKKLNPGLGEYLRAGQTLKVPVIEPDDQARAGEWEGESIRHTVEQGETLYGIARQYGVTIGELKNANPGLNEDLSIGTVLTVPNQEEHKEATESQEHENGGLIRHVVAPGETLYGIARHYGIGIDTLKKYNRGVSQVIAPGQVVLIPDKANEKGYIVHQPEGKESLDGISAKYDVELDELQQMNPDIGRKVKKGQQVLIPVEARMEPTEEEPADTSEATGADDPFHCFRDRLYTGETFNVALMLPLFLEELDSVDFKTEKDITTLTGLLSFRFAGFYAGFKMAVDSLVNDGMKVNLFIYDVDNTPEKAEKVLGASELSSMDLIVGPFYLNNFNKVADFARTYEIPIVNPLTRRDEIVYNNPSVYKLKPSDARQLDILIDYMDKQYPRANIVLLRNYKYKYQSEVAYIRNQINTGRPTSINIPDSRIRKVLQQQEKKSILTENKVLEASMLGDMPGDSTHFSNLVREVVYTDDTITGLKMNLSLVRHNVVIAFSDDIVFTKEMLSQLNKLALDREITLFGLPSWNDFSDMETNHLLNLHLHTFSPTAVNFDSRQVSDWIRKFRARYNAEPTVSNFSFDGFDAGWYFLNALLRYGRDFGDCLQYYHPGLLQTNFEFEHTEGNGYQNIYWNLGKYEDYQYRKIHLKRD